MTDSPCFNSSYWTTTVNPVGGFGALDTPVVLKAKALKNIALFGFALIQTGVGAVGPVSVKTVAAASLQNI